jgi:hypothetical protein
MSNRIVVFKLTDEDWHPSFKIEGKYGPSVLKVAHHEKSPNGIHRVSVWGGDDFGMEFDTDDYGMAWSVFLRICGMPTVTQQALKNLGFITA